MDLIDKLKSRGSAINKKKSKNPNKKVDYEHEMLAKCFLYRTTRPPYI